MWFLAVRELLYFLHILRILDVNSSGWEEPYPLSSRNNIGWNFQELLLQKKSNATKEKMQWGKVRNNCETIWDVRCLEATLTWNGNSFPHSQTIFCLYTFEWERERERIGHYLSHTAVRKPVTVFVWLLIYSCHRKLCMIFMSHNKIVLVLRAKK